MPVYYDNKTNTYTVRIHYKDYTQQTKNKKKRGFATKEKRRHSFDSCCLVFFAFINTVQLCQFVQPDCSDIPEKLLFVEKILYAVIVALISRHIHHVY